jgi:hypothetical protein
MNFASKIVFRFLPLILCCVFSASAQTDDRTVLTASPTQVAAGSGFGKTQLSWQTGDKSEARLFRVREDDSLEFVGKGAAQNVVYTNIHPGKTYEFRLHSSQNPQSVLATVEVEGTRKVDFSFDIQPIFHYLWKRAAFLLLASFLLVGVATYFARRSRFARLQSWILTATTVFVLVSGTLIINKTRPLPLELHPAPDSQETVDGAQQIANGNGYVTVFHGNGAEPPRYPPGFSIALLPFLTFGEYPANVLFGAKFYVFFYLWTAMLAGLLLNGRIAAIIVGLFVAVSPFVDVYASVVMSEAFVAALVVLILILLRDKPGWLQVALAGAIAGALVAVRLQMIVCLPALLLALPTMRQRLWAFLSAAPFLAALAIYNWTTFGSFFKTGYDYWIPHIKPFALFYAVRWYPMGDGVWLSGDLTNAWLLRWICPCEAGGPIAALPNAIIYPLILLGFFWMFAPPFVPAYGLWRAWRDRREQLRARFILWLIVLTVPLFTFYFYQGTRFMTAVSTLLVIYASVGLAQKYKDFIRSDAEPERTERTGGEIR